MLGSMDIVEVNPTLTNSGSRIVDVKSGDTEQYRPSEGASATVELGVHLIMSAMGNRIL